MQLTNSGAPIFRIAAKLFCYLSLRIAFIRVKWVKFLLAQVLEQWLQAGEAGDKP
jgi:hypothetical protein